jgi:hypothetical protein
MGDFVIAECRALCCKAAVIWKLAACIGDM